MKWIRKRAGLESADQERETFGYRGTIAALERLVGERVGTSVIDVATGTEVAQIGVGYLEAPSRSRGETWSLIDEVLNPRPNRDGLWDYLRVPHLRSLKGWERGDSVVFTFGGVRVEVTVDRKPWFGAAPDPR